MSLRLARLAGLGLLAAWTLALTVCGAIPDSVGFVVIAFAFLAACGGFPARVRS